MKSITVGELRQNPTPMLADVAGGETYRITRHGREVARIVPPQVELALTPAKARGQMRLSGRPAHRVRTAASVDDLVDQLKGDW